MSEVVFTNAKCASPKELANALLGNILWGEFPDEDISQAELTPAEIPPIVDGLEKAIGEVKAEIEQLSKANQTRIDSWIGAAGRAREDVEMATTTAEEIVRMEEEEKALRKNLVDAQAHHKFLLTEIRFTQSLASTLGSLHLIYSTLDNVSKLMREGDLALAVAQVQAADHALGNLGPTGIMIVGLMKERVGLLKKHVLEVVEHCWGQLVTTGKSEERGGGWVRVLREVKTPDGVVVGGGMVVEALEALGFLKSKVDGLHQMINTVLIRPRLEVPSGRMEEVPTFVVEEEEDKIRIEGLSKDLSATRVYSDLHTIVTFLHSHLPISLQRPFSRIFIPSLTNRLISQYLPTAIPSALSALPLFQAVLRETGEFESFLQGIGWVLEPDLHDWVSRAPRVWLGKRREDALDTARKAFVTPKWMNGRVVERWGVKVEKGSSEDSWEQSWSDEERQEVKNDKKVEKQGIKSKGKGSELFKGNLILSGDEDEDTSGWGLDEDLDLGFDGLPLETPLESEGEKKAGLAAEDDTPPQIDDMDWGEWGEDDAAENTAGKQVLPSLLPSPLPPPEKKEEEKVEEKHVVGMKLSTTLIQKGKKSTPGSSPEQVVLRETYTVTGMPDAIIELIQQLLEEAGHLATNPKYKSAPIAPAAREMLALPKLVLATYRALAPIYYSVDLASKMYLYNDCMRIEEQLNEVASSVASSSSIFASFSLAAEAAEVAAFGKRHYTRELETQKLIIRDYLDGTQGLVACTDYPQSEACDIAVKAVIDRVKLLHEKWHGVLSQPTLWQALGSLLTTICGKVINDIEDLSDTSEAESRKLARLIGEIADLEALFMPSSKNVDRQGVPCTAMYCDNWLKFRYLESILECTMAELLDLYNGGQLVEFDKEELVDLVKALFSDTEHRRKCLEAIRRGPMRASGGDLVH